MTFCINYSATPEVAALRDYDFSILSPEARVDVAELKRLGHATYAYLSSVNRILGELRDWESESHILNATWSPAEVIRLQGFVYAIDFDNSRPNSSITKGVKASGKTWVGLYQLAYNATYATQSDYRHHAPAPAQSVHDHGAEN